MARTDTLAARYHRLTSKREPYLRRARECAALTLPHLFPPSGAGPATDLATPFQSVGARGVNNIASKLLLALFPPNSPFFELRVDPLAAQAVSGSEKVKTEIEASLKTVQATVMLDLESSDFRLKSFEALKHGIVGGNALLHVPTKRGGFRLFHLDQYVVERDPMGTMTLVITREVVNINTLPNELADAVLEARSEEAEAAAEYAGATDGQRRDPDECELFTACELVRGKWKVRQEVDGVLVPGSRGTFDECPYLALRGNVVSEEDYGRGYVEEYLGDLKTLEGLTQAIVEGSAAAARLLILVKPNGYTRMDDLSNKENGAIVYGDPEDVKPLTLEKFADFNVAAQTAQRVEDRLSIAFLLNSAVQRNAERVTAEEIRFVAQEIEQTVGGLYAMLSQEFQQPVIRLMLARLKRAGRVPQLASSAIKPVVVTGFEAIGRGNDLNRLASAGQVLNQVFPELFAQVMDPLELARRVLVAAQVEPAGLLKSEDQMAQEREAAQRAELVNNLGPEAIRQAGAMGQQAQQNQQEANQ